MLDLVNLPTLLTAKQVAEVLNIPTTSVYTLGLPIVKLSKRRYRWRSEDVIGLIERPPEPPQPPLVIPTADWARPASASRTWRERRGRATE